jgi:hypothetical protein
MIACLVEHNTILFRHEQCQCKRFHGKAGVIKQNVGVMQGDSLSPLLFILYINDVVAKIEEKCPNTTVLLYADDMVILTEKRCELQKALVSLTEWSLVNRIKVNTSKTKWMKFRKGGHLATGDIFKLNNELIDYVKSYVYLGITLQTGLSFHKQIKRVSAKAVGRIGALSTHTSKLSLERAMQVFDVQIKPIVTYGLHLFSHHLKVTTLEHLDMVKSRFLKKVLQLPPTASTELIHRLTGSKRLCEDLAEKNYRFGEKAYTEYLKKIEVDRQTATKFNQLAFIDDSWKKPLQPRHFVVGYSIHGFHHRYCENQGYHNVTTACICRHCHQVADQIDHLSSCSAFDGKSLYHRYRSVL